MSLPGFIPILAALQTPQQVQDLPPATKVPGMQATDLLAVIAVMLAVLTILILWAVFIRKPKNEHARIRIYKSHSDIEETDDGQIRKRKRHKRRRREHRSRNPTLSEAGGLPPMRSDGTPPPV